MSVCISRQGEYGAHIWTAEGFCERCGAEDLVNLRDPQVRRRLAFALEGLLSGGLAGEEDKWAGFLLNVIRTAS